MKREMSLEEFTDGKLYSSRDMVKVDANDCKGCSGCCRGMGSSIILDPRDIWLLTSHLKKTFQELLDNVLELNVVDGLVLPNLRMIDGSDACRFLSAEGRCRIHDFRPGFCRLFPLGRYYENGTFYYVNQNRQCGMPGRTKIRISRWLQIEDLKTYETFCLQWHNLQKEAQEICEKLGDENARAVNLYILKKFFLTDYDSGADFYYQFAARLAEVEATLDAFRRAEG